MANFDHLQPSHSTPATEIPTIPYEVNVPPHRLPVEQYGRDRFVALPGLIQPDTASSLLAATDDVPAKRVRVGNNTETWNEQIFTLEHPVYRFFEQDTIVSLVRALTRLKRINYLQTWTSIYGVGEYINPHTDSEGSAQLLICLQAPESSAQGGKLVVSGQELFLTPGDAIAFEATSLRHYTTPLTATKNEPEPRRTVLVGRYFMG